MDKKDIYEHLAKIYLDASVKKHAPAAPKQHPAVLRNLFILSIACVIVLSTALAASHARRISPFPAEVALVLSPDPLKINFDFNPAKKEIYTLDLNNLDLTRFYQLGFAVKKINPTDTVSLRVEFSNAYNEKSIVYLHGITTRWQNHTINLSDFKEISDWSQMAKLAFIVEEWNTTEKHGVIYVDNVRVAR